MRRFLPVLLGCLSFLALSAGLAKLMPWPHEYGLRAKWEWFRDHKDDYDVLVVGSSVTLYGFVPEVFDEAMAESGRPLRSFNLGAGGMSTLEADYTLHQALALKPKNLDFVFFESAPWDGQVYKTRNIYNPRALHWHSPRQTRVALECLDSAKRKAGEQVPDWIAWSKREHLTMMLRKLTSYGEGPRLFKSLFGLDKALVQPDRETLAAQHGYVDIETLKGAEWDRRAERFLEEMDIYKSRVGNLGKQNKLPVPIENHNNLKRLQEQIEAIRGSGAEPVYYVGPRVAPSPMSYRLAEAGILPTLLGFNRPGKHPELYLPENHFDPNHLNRKGSALFTRELAQAFLASLDD